MIAGTTPGTTATVPEAALVPTAFVAFTEQLYVVPLFMLVTVIGLPAPDADRVGPLAGTHATV